MNLRKTFRTGALLLPLLAGCGVSSTKYDQAVKDASDLRAELARTKSNEADKAKELQRKLDDATAEDERLRAELARLGTNADTLLAEKGTLSSALRESKARLEELRRAQAAAELRAKLYRDLALRLKQMVDAGDLSIALRDGRMVLLLPNDVLFDTGQVEIKPRGKEALKQLAVVLKSIEGRHFQVAGHTDNVPIETARFPSNWELSAARGLVVVHFLLAQGIAPTMLSAAGYGEFDPVAPNDDAKNRARNRRIEITLQPNVNEIVTVPEVR
ncbi:MAG: OmpA family protein [Polyangiaceae bacterium]